MDIPLRLLHLFYEGTEFCFAVYIDPDVIVIRQDRLARLQIIEDQILKPFHLRGESKDTVDSLRTAKKAGARTIAVTNFKDAAISRYADILICTSQEQLMYGDAIFSRSCQILVVDMIYMGIISLDYDRGCGICS